MLDLNFVRTAPKSVWDKLSARGVTLEDHLSFLVFEKERRDAITKAEKLKARLNQMSAQVSSLKRAGLDASTLQAEIRILKAEFDAQDKKAIEFDAEMRALLERFPNLTRNEVPPGKTEAENQIVKIWGVLPSFEFTPKPHWEIGKNLGILDLERAAKISGARFAVYMGAGARLERAIISFMLDIHSTKHGYTEVLPPFMVNRQSLFGTGQLPKFANDLFRCADADVEVLHELKARLDETYDKAMETYDSEALRAYEEAKAKEPAIFNDHWLIPTAEVPVTNLYRDEILDESMLPILHTAYTPCFRAEAGAAGRDTRGIIRQHQFQKVELVKFTRPEDSDAEHEKLTRDAETILELLGLPYRRMLLCTGDTGFSSAKTYDLEVWLPGQGVYREISSCSNFEAFQARRANIRFKRAGKNEFVHTINGSGLAVGRTWLAVVENYQQADGSIRIPDVLKPYMGGLDAIVGAGR